MSSPVTSEALAGFPDLRGSLLEGRYRVGEALGVGGMGAVFEAEHVRLGRKVALKVMRPLYMQYRHHVARFLKEARAASQVKHPNVVEILDVGETPDGTVYTVMEYLDGEDLASILRREGRLPWIEAHGILLQVVTALEAAHEQGVIHRDVKPANCILVAGKSGEVVVKMVDFGIAKFQDQQLPETDPLTKTGEVIGTPAYMAPELSLGRDANARTDIYSVGVLAYQILTGERPFSGATAVEMHLNQTTAPPRPPRSLERTIPVGVENLILQMLAVAPGDRPLNMARVAKDLRALAPRLRATLSMTDFSRMQERLAVPQRITPKPTVEASGDATLADGPAVAPDATVPDVAPQPEPAIRRWDEIEPRGVERSGEAREAPKLREKPPAERNWMGVATRMLGAKGRARRPADLVDEDDEEELTTIPVDPARFREKPVLPRPGVPQIRGKQTLPMGSVPRAEPNKWPPKLPSDGVPAAVSGSDSSHPVASASGSGPISSSGDDPAVPVARTLSPSSSMPQHITPPKGIPVDRMHPSSSSIPLAVPRRKPPPARWSVVLLVVLVVIVIAGTVASVLWWPQIMALLPR